MSLKKLKTSTTVFEDPASKLTSKAPKASPSSSPKQGKRAKPAPKAKTTSTKSKRLELVEASSSEPEVMPSADEHLYGFTSDDDDSSDEDDAMEDTSELVKLPTFSKDDATVKRKLELAKRQPTGDLGVIYIGRLPHGFYEDQLRGYFSQFGDVTRLRLSRNNKTGKSKHYAFLEFDSSSVAKIVAETMDNYLLMGRILRCEVIPKDKVHPEIWVGANKKWKRIPRYRIERMKHDKPRTREEIEKAEDRLIKRQTEKKRKIEEAGIKYDFKLVAYNKRQNA